MTLPLHLSKYTINLQDLILEVKFLGQIVCAFAASVFRKFIQFE